MSAITHTDHQNAHYGKMEELGYPTSRPEVEVFRSSEDDSKLRVIEVFELTNEALQLLTRHIAVLTIGLAGIVIITVSLRISRNLVGAEHHDILRRVNIFNTACVGLSCLYAVFSTWQARRRALRIKDLQERKIATRTTYEELVRPLSEMFAFVERRLFEIKKTEPNWDSYGAQPTSQEALDGAEQLFKMIAYRFYLGLGLKLRPYHIAPLTDGGVQFEWRGISGELEVQVLASGKYNYLLIQGQGDRRKYDEGEDVSASEICSLLSLILNEHNHPREDQARDNQARDNQG